MTSTRSPAKRSRLAPEARRAQLIELGVDLLATRPLDELSVELIAETAGISRGLLFHYFTSKQDFHAAVTKAAAAEMIRRTEPDPDLPPAEALRGAIAAFVAYVEENPDNYLSLVRGGASGDPQLRVIFDDTRTVMAQRLLDVAAGLGLAADDRLTLAVHGWVAYVEECVVRWIAQRSPGRDALLDMLTAALPALAATAGSDALGALTLPS